MAYGEFDSAVAATPSQSVRVVDAVKNDEFAIVFHIFDSLLDDFLLTQERIENCVCTAVIDH